MSEAGLDITYEQMRSLVIEQLRRGGSDQLNDLKWSIAQVALDHGLAVDPHIAEASSRVRPVPGAALSSGSSGPSLKARDYARVQSIMWDLIIEGVVRPGLNDGNNNELPFFHVTELGRHVLKDGPTSPYDPDGYLTRLRRDVADLDDIIVTYLNESLHTFRIGCLLASTVSLGCASEKALLNLISAYADSLSGEKQKNFRNKTEGRMIKRQFDEFRKMLEGDLRSRLPADLLDGLDVELTGLFEFIRQQRNDAGHPTGKLVERERAYANLLVFPVYVRKVYSLVNWLRSGSSIAAPAPP